MDWLAHGALICQYVGPLLSCIIVCSLFGMPSLHLFTFLFPCIINYINKTLNWKKHNKTHLILQGHSQVSSKGSITIQCGSSTYVNVLWFEKWNFRKLVLAVDENRMFPCIACKVSHNNQLILTSQMDLA